MAGCKNQLITVTLNSIICHIEFIIYIRKFTIVNVLCGISYQRQPIVVKKEGY